MPAPVSVEVDAPPPPVRPAAPPPGAAPLACTLKVSFSNNIYPSLLLSLGSADPEYTRCLTVALDGAAEGQNYRVEIASTLLQSAAVSTVRATAGHFEVEPDLPWNFQVLRRVAQLRPETIVVNVYGPKDVPIQASLTCVVHPVNEVISRLYDAETGAWVDMSLCYAAFVNEDHPWINQILEEAVAKDGLARFSGYEFGEESVVRQMQAVWDALAARGLNYVDVATMSGGVPNVATQYVRFLDQSIRDQGANCVDASALFASVFRRIGLRPVLLFRPGHCLVAVYDSAQGGHLLAVETTMLSSASFGEAFKYGSQELGGIVPHLDSPGYSSVDIAGARQSGVRPIEYDDGH